MARELIAATSDWHLGDGGSADDSNVPGIRTVIAGMLDKPITTFAHVGDIGEWWQFGLDAVLRHNADLFVELDAALASRRIPFVLVRGNHDRFPALRLLKALRGVMRACELRVEQEHADVGGWRLEHGHRWDDWNRNGSPLLPLSHGITRAVGWVERAFPGFDETALDPRRLVSPARSHKPRRHAAVHGRAEAWARENGRWICYGHTHLLAKWSSGSAVGVNAGCCVNGHAEFVLLEPDGAAALFDTARTPPQDPDAALRDG
jgi:predicted phosphodiesterase